MYKLKKGLQLPKEFKIKVTPKQSEVLQKHLFSVGYVWVTSNDTKVRNTNKRYLFVSNRKHLSYTSDYLTFSVDKAICIKFKDYFEKVELEKHNSLHGEELYTIKTSFPEKWCILVTEYNYQELKTWMYRNVGNYLGFKYGWFTIKDFSIGHTMYSHAEYLWNEGLKDVFYEEITTEQFRAKYGDLNVTMVQGTEAGSEDTIAYKEGYTTVSDKTIKEEYEERKQLRLENEKLTKNNEDLNDQVGIYYKQVLMLTEKLETIKKVLQ